MSVRRRLIVTNADTLRESAYCNKKPFGDYRKAFYYDIFSYCFFYLSPNPNLLTAEKIALTEALVILELTPTP